MLNISRRSLLASAAAVSILPAAEAAAKAPSWNKSAELVVAGGGAAGCMAAIEAARAGRKVLIVQVHGFLGGSSAVSSGWIRSCNTHWHAKRGIVDTPEDYAKDIVAYGNGTRNPRKAEVIARESGRFVDYLASIGVVFNDDEDRANGGEKLRIVKTQGGGSALMAKLAAAVEADKRITVMTETRLTQVLLDGKKTKVIGVEVETEGRKLRIKTPAVVIATGGFGRNQEIVQKFMNQWAKTGRVMDSGDKGDGLVIAANLGAGVANLNIGMVCPTLEVTKNIFYSSAPIIEGAVIVNEKGRRFTNEYVIYTQTNIDMLKQKATYEIVTEQTHPATVKKMIANGVATRCDSVEALAAAIGCPVEGLKADIEEHNAITRQAPADRKDRFGRVVYGKELAAPFYVLRITPVMIETVGGITIDEKSRVTTLFGEPVAKGLYAAGAVAFGEHFGVGYRSGDAYVYSGVTGMVAGREAAKVR